MSVPAPSRSQSAHPGNLRGPWALAASGALLLIIGGCGSDGGDGDAGGGGTGDVSSAPPPVIAPTAITLTSARISGEIAQPAPGHTVQVLVNQVPATVTGTTWTATIPLSGSSGQVTITKTVDGVPVSSRQVSVHAP